MPFVAWVFFLIQEIGFVFCMSWNRFVKIKMCMPFACVFFFPIVVYSNPHVSKFVNNFDLIFCRRFK